MSDLVHLRFLQYMYLQKNLKDASPFQYFLKVYLCVLLDQGPMDRNSNIYMTITHNLIRHKIEINVMLPAQWQDTFTSMLLLLESPMPGSFSSRNNVSISKHIKSIFSESHSANMYIQCKQDFLNKRVIKLER